MLHRDAAAVGAEDHRVRKIRLVSGLLSERTHLAVGAKSASTCTRPLDAEVSTRQRTRNSAALALTYLLTLVCPSVVCSAVTASTEAHCQYVGR